MTCNRCADLVKQVRGLDAENRRLRGIKLLQFNNDECWLWQGDGFDYPESLSCPVVMSADTLRELIRRAEANTQQIPLSPID